MKNTLGLLAREGHLFAVNLDISCSMPVKKLQNYIFDAISNIPIKLEVEMRKKNSSMK